MPYGHTSPQVTEAGRILAPDKVHPAGAVLDEHQDVQPVQQHGIDVQEVDGEDPGGLGMQELPQVGSVRRGAGSMSAARRIS